MFRARKCYAVYDIVEIDEDTALCKECTELFSQLTRNEDDEEQLDVSEQEEMKICPINNCERSFRRNKALQNHLKSHDQKTPEVSHPKKVKSPTVSNGPPPPIFVPPPQF